MCEHEHGSPPRIGRPMTVYVEVWPVAVDVGVPDPKIRLLSGVGPWPTYPILESGHPQTEAEDELLAHGAGALLLMHQTSTRARTSPVMAAPAIALTYLAVIDCPGLVLTDWPDAVSIDPRLPEVYGRPPTHDAADAPVVRDLDVLLHAIRHLRALTDPTSTLFDRTAAEAVGVKWQRALIPFEPALYTLYSDMHGAA